MGGSWVEATSTREVSRSLGSMAPVGLFGLLGVC